MHIFLIILGLVVVVVAAVPLVVFLMFFNLWLRAKASGVPVSIFDFLFIRLRRIDPAVVVEVMISMSKAGLEVSMDDVESQILAGGDIEAVADAYIRARNANIDVDFRKMSAINLAGRDIAQAVQNYVNPTVVQCPAPGGSQRDISGVCKDGVKIHVSARITVRTRLERLVGGAGQETIIARVGEGIVSIIGSAESHKEILESPDKISQYVLQRGLDSGTCYEILSMDVADVSVDENIGARLQEVQAAADKQIAQAKAEMRRAAAIASRTEMRARTTEMDSTVMEAKAVVPKAVAEAFRKASLGSRKALPSTVCEHTRWRFATK